MKLADISPEAVAREVVRRVVDHLHSVSIGLMPGARLYLDPLPPEEYSLTYTRSPDPRTTPEMLARSTDLGVTTLALTTYAQRGLPVWDWYDSGMAADGLLAVLAALYSRAADHDLSATAIDVVDDVDPSDEVALVLVAAAARVRLDQGHAVSPREVAALADVSATYMRRLVRDGELRSDGGRPARISAEDAARWLAARRVPGIGEPR